MRNKNSTCSQCFRCCQPSRRIFSYCIRIHTILNLTKLVAIIVVEMSIVDISSILSTPLSFPSYVYLPVRRNSVAHSLYFTPASSLYSFVIRLACFCEKAKDKPG